MYNILNKKKPLNYNNLKKIYNNYQCPVWVYDGEKIINQIKKLKKFDIIRFAQKSCSNINILRLIRQQGVKIDSVSLGEIKRALIAGFIPGSKSEEIIFTADLLENETLNKIIKFKIPINAGSIDMLKQLGKKSPKHNVWLRINPGFGHGHNKKTNTGGENSKHGIWHKDIPYALHNIDKYKLKLTGIHMHIGSGVNYTHLSKVCNAMITQVILCNKKIKSISAGGGLPIQYKKQEKKININQYFNLWNQARRTISKKLKCKIKLEIEPGRFLVAESGVLITQIKAIKRMGKNYFILINAGFNDLMRPTMYGSYHHVTILPYDNRNIRRKKYINTIIGGPLCESGDVFTQNKNGDITPRLLPQSKVGDYVIFHDTGAYGSSMSSNYNSRPLLPEVLIYNGKIQQIRRRQNFAELFKLEKQILL